MPNFALTGVAGYIAPRHLQAIRDTGNTLLAAVDPHDSVGILDQFFPQTSFFTEVERFDRHLEKLRRGPEEGRVHYVSICSPNYLHDAHIRLALRVEAHAICEKPLVLNPWNLDVLQDLERELSLAQRWVQGRLADVQEQLGDVADEEYDGQLHADVLAALAEGADSAPEIAALLDKKAVRKGLISEDVITRAVKRLFMTHRHEKTPVRCGFDALF